MFPMNDAGDFEPAPEVPSGNGESRRLLPQENDKTADRDEDEDYNYRLPPMQGRAILIPGLGRLSPVPRHGGLALLLWAVAELFGLP